jgi:hypothetical protein
MMPTSSNQAATQSGVPFTSFHLAIDGNLHSGDQFSHADFLQVEALPVGPGSKPE